MGGPHQVLAVAALLAGMASPAPPSASGGTWCPVSVVAMPLDSSRVALGFSTPLPSGRASGIVRLIAGGSRYDIRFDTIVPHDRKTAAGSPPAVPVIVRFPAPVRLESAVVTSLDEPAPGPCSPLYAPWRPGGLASWLPSAADATFFAQTYADRTATAPVQDAPPPIAYAPPVCERRFVPPFTVKAFEPQDVAWNGRVNVVVTVGADGKALAVEVPKPSGNALADAVAKDAAARSQYAPQVFDCEKIVGTYTFSVEFSITR
jgi:TonB family protein